MDKPLLSRTECAALRGLAIIGIFLHNYCHWLGMAVKENEYTFTMSKSSQLMQVIASPDIYLPYTSCPSSDITACRCSSSSRLTDWP